MSDNCRDIAIRITEKSKDMIAVVNEGVRPELEDVPTYFVLTCANTDHDKAMIMTEENFQLAFEPVALPVGDDAFVQVREID